MNLKAITCFSLLLVFILGCRTNAGLNNTKPNTYRVGFYNVENLFDLEDNPEKADDDFTPDGKQKWTADRYHKKLSQMARVVEGMEYPTLLGLSEVENEAVMQDFCTKTSLKNYDYGTVHFESPDFRGIDVGLIYRQKFFQVFEVDFIRINFPETVVEDYTTRDILWVKGAFHKKDTFHVFVNHWPSRRGGLQKSEPKRLYVAEQLHKKITQILNSNANANIIIMGDFNDEPTNKSIEKILTTQSINGQDYEANLFNCFSELDKQNQGTYNYRGNWNMLDQIIVSKNLQNKHTKWQTKNATIFAADWLFYEDKKYGKKPNRTYGGPRYYGGFSDHLPVFVDINK